MKTIKLLNILFDGSQIHGNKNMSLRLWNRPVARSSWFWLALRCSMRTKNKNDLRACIIWAHRNSWSVSLIITTYIPPYVIKCIWHSKPQCKSNNYWLQRNSTDTCEYNNRKQEFSLFFNIKNMDRNIVIIIIEKWWPAQGNIKCHKYVCKVNRNWSWTSENGNNKPSL